MRPLLPVLRPCPIPSCCYLPISLYGAPSCGCCGLSVGCADAKKSDVWALGCILYEMATLRHAFDGRTLPALVLKILRGKYQPVSEHYSADMRDLIAQLLHQNPDKRPTIRQILVLPLLRQRIKRLVPTESDTEDAKAPPGEIDEADDDEPADEDVMHRSSLLAQLKQLGLEDKPVGAAAGAGDAKQPGSARGDKDKDRDIHRVVSPSPSKPDIKRTASSASVRVSAAAKKLAAKPKTVRKSLPKAGSAASAAPHKRLTSSDKRVKPAALDGKQMVKLLDQESKESLSARGSAPGHYSSHSSISSSASAPPAHAHVASKPSISAAAAVAGNAPAAFSLTGEAGDVVPEVLPSFPAQASTGGHGQGQEVEEELLSDSGELVKDSHRSIAGNSDDWFAKMDQEIAAIHDDWQSHHAHVPKRQHLDEQARGDNVAVDSPPADEQSSAEMNGNQQAASASAEDATPRQPKPTRAAGARGGGGVSSPAPSAAASPSPSPASPVPLLSPRRSGSKQKLGPASGGSQSGSESHRSKASGSSSGPNSARSPVKKSASGAGAAGRGPASSAAAKPKAGAKADALRRRSEEPAHVSKAAAAARKQYEPAPLSPGDREGGDKLNPLQQIMKDAEDQKNRVKEFKKERAAKKAAAQQAEK